MKMTDEAIAKMFLEMYANINKLTTAFEASNKRQEEKESEQDLKLHQLCDKVEKLDNFKTKVLTISSIIMSAFSGFLFILKK